MEVKYGDYSYSDAPQRNVYYYRPIAEPFNAEQTSEYSLIGNKTKVKTRKKPIKNVNRRRITRIIKETNTSDITQEGKSNEKLYIGLLIGSTGLFLVTLFYFLFATNKRKK